MNKEELMVLYPSVASNILNPDWDSASRVHDWRNYIPEEFKINWDGFLIEAKAMAYYFASKMANDEEWD